MSYSQTAEKTYAPGLDASDEQILDFVKRHINDDNRFRRLNMFRKATNLWAYKGRHWVRAITQARSGSSGIYHFEDIRRASGRPYPEPVDNMIATGIDNEVARLGRKEYVPETTADSGQPELQQAARTAKNVLLYDLEQMVWADIREALMFDLSAMGTCIAHSYWDETQTEHSVVASPDAVFCQSCGYQFASSKIPLQLAQVGYPGPDGLPMPLMHSETLRAVEDDGTGRPPEVQMTNCPVCFEPTPLQPRAPLPEEVQGTDIFQRPLGLLVPKGSGLIEHDSPFEVYPENAGINIEPRNCRIWGLKKVRDLEWIGSRFPEWEIVPEEPRELMKAHPTMGDDSFSGAGNFSAEGDRDVFHCHAAVKQVFVDPMKGVEGLEQGAIFTVIGKDKVDRKPLMVDVEVPGGKTKQVRRAKFGAHRRKRVPGEFWGRTPVDDALPLQRRLNQLDAMSDDIMERSKPWIAVPYGTMFDFPEDPRGSMHIVEVDTTNGNYDDFKIVVPPGNDADFANKRAQIAQSIRDRLGPQEVEAGATGTAKTALEVKVLSEQVEEVRGPVERGLVKNVYTPLFQHHLEIAWAFKKDDSTYEIEETTGTYGVESYTGTDMLGNVKVQVESKGDFSKSVYEITATKEAVGLGLYGIDWQSDPVLRNQILEQMDLPKADGKTGLQILRAQQGWSRFIKEGTIPAFDPTIHDPGTWFRVLNESWLGDEAMELQQAANWGEFVDLTAGWERALQQAEAQDMAQREMYEGHPPEQWAGIKAEADAKVAEITAAQEQTAKAASEMPVAPVPPPVPPPQIPEPPQTGEFLPEALHLKIRMVLQSKGAPMLQPVPQVPGLPPKAMANKSAAALEPLIGMYSVIQAARILSLPPALPMPPPGMPPAGPTDAAAPPMAA